MENLSNDPQVQGDEDFDLSILDRNFDDIEDLPAFQVPPTGDYILEVKGEFKTVNKKKAFELGYVIVSCVEQSDAEDTPAKPGDKFSQLFFLSSDKTGEEAEKALKLNLGLMKAQFAGIAEQTGQSNLLIVCRDILKSAIVKATVVRKQDKQDKDVFRARVSNMTLA